MVLFIITGNTFSTARTLAANRLDTELQRPIDSKEVPERRNCDRTRPMACDRTPSASDQLIVALTVGTTGRVRSGRFSVRSVAVSWEFDPNGYFLSGAYKYNPNRPFEKCGAEEPYQGC